MNVFNLLEAMKHAAEEELASLRFPKEKRKASEEDVPWAAPTVYIGALPPTPRLSALAPFVLLQDTGGACHPTENVQLVDVAVRVCVQDESETAAVRDFHLVASALAHRFNLCRRAALNNKYVLVPLSEEELIRWTRPDDQTPPYQEGYLLTRWQLFAGI